MALLKGDLPLEQLLVHVTVIDLCILNAHVVKIAVFKRGEVFL